MENKIKRIIETLNLLPHPEGGYFKETYRSEEEIGQDALGSQYKGKRNHSTCIYFLLTTNMFSAFHKINQDEIWHFYEGGPLNLHIISPTGEYSKTVIGNNVLANERPQIVVKGGSWFAADVINVTNETTAYSLVGCTVSPGFDFNDFDLAKQKELVELFPQHKIIIEKLTRG
jgi:hypothetical protein